MSTGASTWTISTAIPPDAAALHAFAARQPLLWNDFASIADTLVRQPDLSEPRIWLVRTADGTVDAAAIDDALRLDETESPTDGRRFTRA